MNNKFVSLFFIALVLSSTAMPAAETPLHGAAQDGNVKLVRILLGRAETNVNAANQFGWTPLHYAAIGGHIKCIQLLLNNGAELNAKDNANRTPLHFAAKNGHKECVALLLQNGAKIDEKDTSGLTPLHYAAWKDQPIDIKLFLQNRDWPACIKELLQNDAKIDEKDNIGFTPLHLIALTGFKDSAELLLQKGANLEVKDTDGKTAKDLAQENGHEAIVKLIESYEIPDIKEPESDETVS